MVSDLFRELRFRSYLPVGSGTGLWEMSPVRIRFVSLHVIIYVTTFETDEFKFVSFLTWLNSSVSH